MIDGGYPAWILEQGRPYGQAAVELPASVLQQFAPVAAGVIQIESAQQRIVRRRAQRPQPFKLLLAALLGNIAGRAIGPLVVRLVQPLAELLDQIVAEVVLPGVGQFLSGKWLTF